MATFSVFAHGTKQQTGAFNATHNIPMPAGTLTGKLLIIITSSLNIAGTVTTPSGFTVLSTDSSANIHVFGKIGTSSESTVALTWTVNDASQAWCVAIDSTSGWPAIGSVFVKQTRNTGIGAGADIRHPAHTADAGGGNCLLAIGVKYSNLTSITISDVAASSGWVQAGFTTGPTNASGYCTAAEVRTAATTASESVAQRDRTITTWAATATGRNALTVELAPVNTSISVDDSTIDPLPATVVTITKTAVWNGAVTATIEGTAITLTAINTTQKSFTLDIPDLLPGGAWNAIRPSLAGAEQYATLAVTDSDGTFTTEVQVLFSPSAGEDYVNSPGANIGTYIAVPGAVIGDPQFGYWHLGDNVRDKTISGIVDAGTGYFSPITLPSQGRLIAYDVSAAVWLAAVNTSYYSEAEASAGAVEGVIMAIVRPVVKSLVEVIT